MGNFFKNLQLRLLVSAGAFTGAFVWMAISVFDVEKEVIRVFLILTFLFIGGLMVCGFAFSFVLRFINSRFGRGGLLDKVVNVKDRPKD